MHETQVETKSLIHQKIDLMIINSAFIWINK